MEAFSGFSYCSLFISFSFLFVFSPTCVSVSPFIYPCTCASSSLTLTPARGAWPGRERHPPPSAMIHFDLYLYCLDVVPVMVRVGNGLDWSGYPSDSASVSVPRPQRQEKLMS